MLARKVVACLFVLSVARPIAAQTPGSRQPPGKKAGTTRAAGKQVEPSPPDVAIQTKYTSGAQVSVNKTYFKGARQRFDFPGLSLISQCDLGRTVQLNEATRRYLVVPNTAVAQPIAPPARPPTADPMAAMSSMGAPGSAQAQPAGGVIIETTTLSDTGERRMMFGQEARHIKTVTVRQPDANACDPEGSRVETDGWFIDLPERTVCPTVPTPAAPPAPAGQACTDRIEVRQVGDAKLGFALSTTIATIAGDGRDVTTASMEVTDLKVGPLDAALFEVPAGYGEVKSYQELLPALSSGGSLADAVFGSLADGTSAVAPKKTGVIRVGIADPVNKSGRPLSMGMLRRGLLSGLSKTPFEALPVTGAQLLDIDQDAVGKACDYVLVAEVAELKTSKPGKVGGLLRRASGEVDAPTEVHDARVDYRLYAVGSQAKPRLASSAKASSGKFGVGSALKVAKFAGTLYLGLNTRMMMGGGGMMGPYASLMSSGGGGGGLANRVMSPGMGSALSTMLQAQTMAGPGMALPAMGVPGMEDASSQRAAETVDQALAKAAGQVAEELKKGKP